MWVLGLNAPPLGWHDPAACLVDGDGVVHALVEEERITRRKHALRLHPRNAAQACLAMAGITPADIDIVAVGWDLRRHAARTDLAHLDPPVLGRTWRFEDTRRYIAEVLGWRTDKLRHPELVCVPHHDAHAASAFYASGHEAAAVLVADGHGDDESVSIYDAARGRPLIRRERRPIPASLGYMYDSVSELLGLTFLDAGKTMGLAAYGRDRGMTPWPMFDLTDDGYAPPFDLPASATQKEIVYAWWDHVRALGFHRRLCPSRDLDSWNDAVRLAWSAQSSLEQVFAWLAERARRLVGRDLLCLSGGVALNCSSNGLLPPPVYAPPVPHDAGVALGAAWCVVPPRHTGPPLGPYLGRTVPRTEIEAALSKQDLTARDVSPAEIGERLLHGEIGAVVTGRAEIGPRALCHRSIISSAHDVTLRDRLNAMKGREPWRPLCPVGLVECEGRYWGANDSLHRYMIGASVATGRGRTELPAAVHVDGTLRPQVMSDERELMWSVLDSLRSAGAPPAVINTSFNVNGEPVVDDAHGAIESARTIGLDFLVLDDRIVDLRGRAPKNRERAAAASRSPSVHGHAVPSHTP